MAAVAARTAQAAQAARGAGQAAPTFPPGRLRALPLPGVMRIDTADQEGWLARDQGGRLWQVLEDGSTRPLGEGLAPQGALAVQHGRIAGRGLDGRLWVQGSTAAQPQRSTTLLAPEGGLCNLAWAVIGLVEHEGHTRLARFESDSQGQWQVAARSEEAVLPDAVPVAVDLDGSGAHLAVLAGPDRQRYPHAVLGDDVEATRVLWLERHSLRPLRTLQLAAPEVFEDRQLRPWRLPDGRQGLVTMRSGPRGAQLAVVAAAPREASALEVAMAGPAIGTRNRWMSAASVGPADTELWAVHTPHIGGVLHRYTGEGSGLGAQRVLDGITNHRLGDRELDVSARLGRWLLLPSQDWRQLRVVDLDARAVVAALDAGSPILQLLPSPGGRSAAVLTRAGLAIFSPPGGR